jgi:hypothetical protein
MSDEKPALFIIYFIVKGNERADITLTITNQLTDEAYPCSFVLKLLERKVMVSWH